MQDRERIIELCRKGDARAQETLYQSLSPLLMGVAMRYMRQRDEAEDVMQEAFVKVFTHLSSFRGEGSFEGWCRRITANEALMALKKKKQLRLKHEAEYPELEADGGDDNGELSTEELIACMSELPLGYSTIINLFLVEEFSHREIAEKLGISESTSRSQYSRARQALFKLLKQRFRLSEPKKLING